MKRYLYFTVFASGLTTLAIELSASRLLGIYFGASNLVWASIIGLILIYLTVGYFVGGMWADRSPTPGTMYTILSWGAFTSGLVPFLAHPVLSRAADAFDQLQIGFLFGSFAGVLVLFAVPVTLLGMVSPFAIRLLIPSAEEAGKVSGQVYATSTLGSFIGTFIPDLVLLPLIGTLKTFLLLSAFLLVVALIGFARSVSARRAIGQAWMLLVLATLGLLLSNRPLKATSGQIYEAESAYNYIQVLEINGYRMLRLNEGQGIHSTWHPDQLGFRGPWQQFLAAPFFNAPPYAPEDVDSIAIVGLAAGTVARQATQVFGPIPIDGFEIDPKIIAVAQEYFEMNHPNLNPIAQDGRWGLSRSERHYSVIAVDAYRPPYIPWHLTTKEFFEMARGKLVEDGVLVVNVGRAPEDRRLIEAIVGTLKTVFPSVYVMDVPDTFNSVVYATKQATQMENLYANLLDLYEREDAHPLLIDSIQQVVVYQQPTPEGGMVFTDDWAPVEWLINDMVLRFVFAGEVENLQ